MRMGSCPSGFSVELQSGFAIDWSSEKRRNQATLPRAWTFSVSDRARLRPPEADFETVTGNKFNGGNHWSPGPRKRNSRSRNSWKWAGSPAQRQFGFTGDVKKTSGEQWRLPPRRCPAPRKSPAVPRLANLPVGALNGSAKPSQPDPAFKIADWAVSDEGNRTAESNLSRKSL